MGASTLLQALLAACGLYAAAVALVFVFQRSLMYHPAGPPGTPAAAGLALARALSVRTEDGLELVSWYQAPESGKPVIVHFHGNAGNIADRVANMEQLAGRGYGLLLVEYRGFGGNPGTPTEAGLYADARANLAWLADAGHSPATWVLYGESLGSGVATRMAWELARAGTPVAALVLEAPFTSMADAAQHHYSLIPARILTRDRYANKDRIADVRAPVLIMHGGRDATVPEAMGRRLFNLAREPKQAFWVAEANHINLYDFGAADAVIAFLAGIKGPR